MARARAQRAGRWPRAGQPLGEVGARKKTSVRTHAGPRESCALPASDARTCGAPGTIRKAYLHEGWSLTVLCDE